MPKLKENALAAPVLDVKSELPEELAPGLMPPEQFEAMFQGLRRRAWSGRWELS